MAEEEAGELFDFGGPRESSLKGHYGVSMVPFQVPSCEELPSLQRVRQDGFQGGLNLVKILRRVGYGAYFNGLDLVLIQLKDRRIPRLHLFARWLN